jgi:hypothetical protein
MLIAMIPPRTTSHVPSSGRFACGRDADDDADDDEEDDDDDDDDVDNDSLDPWLSYITCDSTCGEDQRYGTPPNICIQHRICEQPTLPLGSAEWW